MGGAEFHDAPGVERRYISVATGLSAWARGVTPGLDGQKCLILRGRGIIYGLDMEDGEAVVGRAAQWHGALS